MQTQLCLSASSRDRVQGAGCSAEWTNLIRHVGDLILVVYRLSPYLWRGDLSVLDFVLVWPGIQRFLQAAFEDLTSSPS